MKLKPLCGSIITTFIMLITSAVFAATGTIDIKSNTNKVKVGDTFIVTLYATSEDGINGIDTKYTYDSEKLELIAAELADSLKWSNLGINQNITVICNTTESIKSADIYILKFKVKENVAVGDILKIETTDILLDTDAQTNSEVSIAPKKVEVEVVGDTTDKPIDPADEKPQEKPTDSANERPQDKPINPTDEKTEDKSANPVNDKQEDKTVTSEKNINADNSKDLTNSTEKLPQTGDNTLIIFGLIATGIVLSIIFGKKYMKLNI